MDKVKGKTKKISHISMFHYIKLGVHSVLFLITAALYLVGLIRGDRDVFNFAWGQYSGLLIFIWILFAAEMIGRFFPAKMESMGCQKVFSKNYHEIKGSELPDRTQERHSVALIAVVWIAFNAVFAALYYCHVIDVGVMLLLAIAYSICDMICVLFFCPFQTWFMKNKCCGTCRIYNWDYAMMFTPFMFIPGIYTWTLAALSIGLLVQWEVTHAKHPERFYEATNESLRCANCQEKLCHHKKQLQRFSREQLAKLREAAEKGTLTIAGVERKKGI